MEFYKSYFTNEQNIDVFIEFSHNKHLYLKIKKNKLVAIIPQNVPKKITNNFIEKNIPKFAKYFQEKKANENFSFSKKFIYILGTKYNLNIIKNCTYKTYKKQNDTFIFKTSHGSNEECLIIVKKLLKKELKNVLNFWQNKWEKKLDIPQHEIKVTYKNGTWGVNYINKKIISYSSKLAHYSLEIINAIIIHELAHYKEPNHSYKFWNIVYKYCPNYKEILKKLKWG